MAERIFRVFSLAFLSIGFVVAIAGADRNGPQDLANATSDLIQHVSAAKDANSVNASPSIQSNKGITLDSETKYVAKAGEDVVVDTNPSQKLDESLKTLPAPTN